MTFGNFLFFFFFLQFHIFFLNATFTQISFVSDFFFYVCVRLGYFFKAYVTLTCLVMQMSSMQIHSRFVFERQLSLLYQLLVFFSLSLSLSLHFFVTFCCTPVYFRPQNQLDLRTSHGSFGSFHKPSPTLFSSLILL